MGSEHPNIYYNSPLPNTKEKGFSSIYRNPRKLDGLINTPSKEIATVRDFMVQSCLKKYSNKPCLGKIILTNNGTEETRTIQNLTYLQTFQAAESLGSSLIRKNLCSIAQDNTLTKGRQMKFIGIFSKNCQEWGITDIGCVLFGITSIPLYDTLGIENLSYCLNHTKMISCFCSAATAQILLKLNDIGQLKNIILFDKSKQIQSLQKKFKIFHFQQLIEDGNKNKVDYKKIEILPSDCYSFSYTSGTTGPPKGAMFSHSNIVAMIASVQNDDHLKVYETDRYLSFLPLPHSMERVFFNLFVYSGSNVVFYAGDTLKIKDDCKVVKPTVFAAVPRLYNKIVEAVEAKFEQTSGIKRCLVFRGINSKKTAMEETGEYQSSFYDSLVFSNTKQAFGGCVRLMVSGSAPLRKEIHEMMKIIMGAPLIEGYGQTQNTAGAFSQAAKDPIVGHVGGVVGALQFKLMDIPEMSYNANDTNQQGQSTPRGEIWLRGPQVFMGYYRDSEKTKEAITNDGWLRTGDVGMICPITNALKIIDRKKNIFKLQQGEYVASEKVEQVYGQSHLVQQIFLHGESTHIFAVAILTPNKEELKKIAHSVGLDNVSQEQAARDKRVRTAIAKHLDTVGKKGGLMSFQQAKNVYLELKTFQERGILTNTLKLQRFQAKKYYAQQIQEMYKEGMLEIK